MTTASFYLTMLSFQTPVPLPFSNEASTYLGLKASEWIMITAIVVGPIFAVITQFVWQSIRQKRDQKLWVFSTLMSNRSTPLALDFVRAANYIDVVFYKERKVRERWKAVLAHLTSDAYKPENFTQAAFERFRDLLAELLAEMAKDLRYEYDYTHIKENAWYPLFHGVELEQNVKIRQKLLELMDGKGRINVVVSPDPSFFPPATTAKPVPEEPGGAAGG